MGPSSPSMWDVGRVLSRCCSPPYLTNITGIDADRAMIEEARAASRGRKIRNVDWRQMRGEDLPADLGKVDLVTFAQSFHWMQRVTVATLVRGMLGGDGACVVVHATTHRGDESQDRLPHPRPPCEEISNLVRTYLHASRETDSSSRETRADDAVFGQAGFTGPDRFDVTRGEAVERSVDEVIAATFSLSTSTPRLFGRRRDDFERDLRQLLDSASDASRFSERVRDIAAHVWRPRRA